jgi:hypothetical protein
MKKHNFQSDFFDAFIICLLSKPRMSELLNFPGDTINVLQHVFNTVARGTTVISSVTWYLNIDGGLFLVEKHVNIIK